jgi:hypothetical protein
MKVLFTSHNLIGDGLYVGPSLREWIEQQTQPVDVWMSTLPDHVACLYEGMVRDLWNPGTLIHTFGTVFNRPEGITFDFEHVFDVNKAFIVSRDKQQHLARSYADLLGVKLAPGNEAVKPIYIPDTTAQGKWMEGPHEPLGLLAGCIIISMFSASCESRDKNTPGLPPNKMLPVPKWLPMLRLLKKEFPDVPIRFVGAPTDILPDGFDKFGDAMFGIPLNRLMLILQKAALLVTIDNGVSHMGASQETPTFLMYPRCLAPYYILPVGNPNLSWCHIDPVYVSPAQLEFQLSKTIQKLKEKQCR